MSFYLYLLRCSDGSYYVGHTDNLEKRLEAHTYGEISSYTATRRPVQLAVVEEYATRIEALTRERQIKGWSRRKKQALIHGDWGQLVSLARSRGSTGSPRTVNK